jgi:hypothetical protein
MNVCMYLPYIGIWYVLAKHLQAVGHGAFAPLVPTFVPSFRLTILIFALLSTDYTNTVFFFFFFF